MSTETEERVTTSVQRGAIASPVYAVRGSLIVSSLESLRRFGYFEEYLRALAPTWREQVVFCLASSWVPVELAVAHYAAHEALQLPAVELVEMGELVGERVAGAFLGALRRSSRTQGLEASPWIPLREYRRLCERVLQGGSVAMHVRGEKEARLELSGAPLMRFAAFRQTMLALTRLAVGSFVCRAFVRELAASRMDSEQLRIQVRWL
jgi:hypothetical protein